MCEDTRTSRPLLTHYGITVPLKSFHMHNEHAQVPHVIERLRAGTRLALISDSGTPGISDPAFLLTRACVAAQLPFEVLPGPCALITALVESALPITHFSFFGFLPVKKGRLTMLRALAVCEQTICLYESPHRIERTLQDLREHLGDQRRCAVSRELTKKFSETVRGTLAEVAAHFAAQPPRGEFVIVVEGGNGEPLATELEIDNSER